MSVPVSSRHGMEQLMATNPTAAPAVRKPRQRRADPRIPAMPQRLPQPVPQHRPRRIPGRR
jgi:hypothetical protein